MVGRVASHPEIHWVARIGWLRAAVLGANDGIVSTASLIVGVAAASASPREVALTGVAGLVAGAMSMAAGEYVSVSSQADTEAADLDRERTELAADPESEQRELVEIYMGRGLTQELAGEVAQQLTARDAIGAHARDELGLVQGSQAQPFQAAWTSALTFSIGAAIPLLAAIAAPSSLIVTGVAASSLVALASLGAAGALAGGAPVLKASLRVAVWGALAMAVTSGVGHLFGTTVG